jgi:hypothetical protein
MPVHTLPPGPWRLARIGFALALVLVGAVTAPTPIPIGLALLGLGIAILLVESRMARRALYGLRYRFPGFSTHLGRAGTYLPARMRRVLDRTDPWRRPLRAHRHAGAPREP